MQKPRWLAMLSLLFMTITHPLNGQESQPITTENLVKRSAKILVGEVVSQYSAWDDLGREIYTYSTLRVNEIIKSDREDSVVVIRQLGGEVGNIESHVAGLPRFKEGEQVLVFLGPYTGTEYYGLIDWAVGKYVIEKDDKAEKVLHGSGPGKGQTVDQFARTLRRFL